MEKEKLLVNIGRAPMTSLRSSPSNSNSNSMDYHTHTHTHNQVSMGLGDLNCFLNLNWDNSMMGVDHDSALSSMVSSPLAPPQQTPNSTTPTTTTTNNNNNNSNFVIRELIGRLGGICNSGEAQFNSHSNSSILELDPNPPHNPTLDQGFYERAARYSQFNSIPTATTGKLSRVSSNQSLKAASGAVVDNRKLLSRSCTPDNAELDESSASEPKNVNSTRKRKATTTSSKPKSKETTIPSSAKDSKVTAKNEDESNAKRSKTTETEKAEPPKDYIHVRARRGQATDSHSLAERVRREKISERMKFLQDLVPGCNKVTGKAVMLDEIINYVQSLQRQVEFLSMKLATVNPRMEVNMETLFSKEILQSHGSSAHTIHPTDSMASAFPYGHHHQSLQSSISNGLDTHCSVNPLDVTAQRLNLSMQLPSLDGYVDNDAQLAAFWGDDLQSIVQMGFGQSQSGGETAFQTQSFHGSLPTSHMKVEL